MPLREEIRKNIEEYCTKDMPGDLDWHINAFEFIDDDELKKRLGRAYYSARYIAKLMEALYADGDFLHPFVKFQIIQYASIYEAVVNYLLWKVYSHHHEVRILQTHKAYKPVAALGSKTNFNYDGEQLHTCVYKDTKTPKNSISFKEKIDCAVRIGFVDVKYAEVFMP